MEAGESVELTVLRDRELRGFCSCWDSKAGTSGCVCRTGLAEMRAEVCDT
jgi:hypothetical protein